MNPEFISAYTPANSNLDASLANLIASVRQDEQERVINLLLNLSHLIDRDVVSYVASIVRGGQHAVN